MCSSGAMSAFTPAAHPRTDRGGCRAPQPVGSPAPTRLLHRFKTGFRKRTTEGNFLAVLSGSLVGSKCH